MSQSPTPFSPLQHCPQCDGPIDSRAMRTEPMRRSHHPFPRRRTECFCDFCKIGFRVVTELQGEQWKLHQVIILRGQDAARIRQYAESQTGVIQRKAS